MGQIRQHTLALRNLGVANSNLSKTKVPLSLHIRTWRKWLPIVNREANSRLQTAMARMRCGRGGGSIFHLFLGLAG